jgi:hypothetical protein
MIFKKQRNLFYKEYSYKYQSITYDFQTIFTTQLFICISHKIPGSDYMNII